MIFSLAQIASTAIVEADPCQGMDHAPIVEPQAPQARESVSLISFTVPGEPIAKGRGRVGINRGTGRAVVFTPKTTRKAESDVASVARVAMGSRAPFAGPLILEVVAYRAKGMPKTRKGMADAEAGLIAPTTKPDASNVLKLIEDACNGILYADDALIVDAVVRRRFSSNPRVEVTVRQWTP